MLSQVANVLDPVHTTLDARVWDKPGSTHPVLKPKHAHWVKKSIYSVLDQAGYSDPQAWLTLCVTGSLTTYQYSDDSDLDVSLFVDSEKFPEWSRAEMIGLMVSQLDEHYLPGTPFSLQAFVIPEGVKPHDIYRPGLRSAYDLDNGKWIVPPEKERVHDIESEQNGFYSWALQMADKMERLLRYEPSKAVDFWHAIHRRRRRDMQNGKGDTSESNIVYKFLAQRGLLPQIAQTSGECIASLFGPPKPHPPDRICPDCEMRYLWDEVEQPNNICGGCLKPTIPAIKPYKGEGTLREELWQLKKASAHTLQYHRDVHPEGKGFLLGDGSVWTWPTENLKPTHAEYNYKAKQQGQQVVPGSAFHIKEGKVWQYGPGRSLSPEQEQAIYMADPSLEPAPSRRQEELDTTPGYGHGQNVLDILERESATKPPNLRKSTGEHDCGNCWAFKNGHCTMYDGYSVEEDQVCDSWEATKKESGYGGHIRDPRPREELEALLREYREIAAMSNKHALPLKMAIKGLEEELGEHDRVLSTWQVVSFPYDEQFISELMPQHTMEKGDDSGEFLVPTLKAMHPSQGEVGHIQYTTGDESEPYPPGILMLRTHEPYKRKGIATWMMDKLQERYPDQPIDLGGYSDSGREWARHYQDDPGYNPATFVKDRKPLTEYQFYHMGSSLHELIERMFTGIMEGGITLNLAGEEPTTRYGFAPDKSTEERIPLQEVTQHDVEAYIQHHLRELSQPGKYLGSWIKDGDVWFDVTEGHDDYNEAFKRAWAGEQQAMYDSQAEQDIPVRGLNYYPVKDDDA